MKNIDNLVDNIVIKRPHNSAIFEDAHHGELIKSIHAIEFYDAKKLNNQEHNDYFIKYIDSKNKPITPMYINILYDNSIKKWDIVYFQDSIIPLNLGANTTNSDLQDVMCEILKKYDNKHNTYLQVFICYPLDKLLDEIQRVVDNYIELGIEEKLKEMNR